MSEPAINLGPAVENDAYAAMMRRMVRAHGRRVAAGDLDDLTALAHLYAYLGDTLTAAVAQLREQQGFSWADIGAALGITRQAAQQRFGRKDTP